MGPLRMPQTDENDHVIVVQDLCRDFGETRAVRNLELVVRRGELFGLVGPDGAGKTTTIRMLAGILQPTSGNAWIDGVSVVEDPEGVKEHIAYMPQRFGLYQDLTVIENLVFYADLFQVPAKDRASRMEELFAFSRLGPFKNRLAGALSGGMKQKLGLACALIHSPRLILLDEPTNGVDPVSRRDFWRILYELLNKGITILVSTADLDEAERTTRTALISDGKLIDVGTPAYLKSLVHGVMMELAPSDVSGTRKSLVLGDGVLDVNVFGDTLHVRLENKSVESVVKHLLSQGGVEILSWKWIDPSMEDAFLSLIPRQTSRRQKGYPD